ncbi:MULTISPECIES: hypothetical protein [unclassified Streptomyces]|uniref:hypothetical protein n=1 Tax=unclassified Streptomyces TaxID=2593676 RepID=UPI0038144716
MSGPAPQRRNRPAALVAAVLGAALVLGAGWLFLVTVPRALDDERAFTSAAGCPVARVSAECRHSVAATVTSVVADHKHRSTYYWLGFDPVPNGPEAASPLRVKMDGRTPVFAAVQPGAMAQLTYWQGEIRYVEYRDLRQYTSADPRGGYRLPFAAALVLLFVGGAALRGAHWWSRRATEPPAHEPWRLTVPLASALLLACCAFGTPWVAGGVPTALLLTAAGAVPVLAGAAWLTRRHRRRTTDTIRVTPLLPGGRECFPGRVLGEVPYSHEGFGYLVAAPGLLASTPDPTGHLARHPVPRTLTPVRVRPPYWTDPGPRPAPGSQVVECRDGSTPVYVVTEQRYTAWVLGALTRAAGAEVCGRGSGVRRV